MGDNRATINLGEEFCETLYRAVINCRNVWNYREYLNNRFINISSDYFEKEGDLTLSF